MSSCHHLSEPSVDNCHCVDNNDEELCTIRTDWKSQLSTTKTWFKMLCRSTRFVWLWWDNFFLFLVSSKRIILWGNTLLACRGVCTRVYWILWVCVCLWVSRFFVARYGEQTDVFIICMWDWYIKLIGEITTKMLVFNQETIYNVENVNMKGESLLKLQTIN